MKIWLVCWIATFLFPPFLFLFTLSIEARLPRAGNDFFIKPEPFPQNICLWKEKTKMRVILISAFVFFGYLLNHRLLERLKKIFSEIWRQILTQIKSRCWVNLCWDYRLSSADSALEFWWTSTALCSMSSISKRNKHRLITTWDNLYR